MIKGLSEFEKYKVIRPIIGECEYNKFGFPIIKKPDESAIDWDNIILKGVHIGARSIVATGSVVTKSIPADEIWGGNPAKFIRKIL